MTAKENFNPEKEPIKERSIINEFEKYILKQALEAIYIYYLKKQGPKNLPKILIFPDTSARLLVYLVKPLFYYFYQKYNLPLPAIVFVRTPQHEIEQPSQEELQLLDQRCQEIKDKFHLKEEDKLLVIDNIYFTGKTFKRIEESFKKAEPSLKIDGFFFIARKKELPQNCFYAFATRQDLIFSFYGNKYTGVTKQTPEPDKYVKKVKKSEAQRLVRKELFNIGMEFVNPLTRKTLFNIGMEFVRSLKEKFLKRKLNSDKIN